MSAQVGGVVAVDVPRALPSGGGGEADAVEVLGYLDGSAEKGHDRGAMGFRVLMGVLGLGLAACDRTLPPLDLDPGRYELVLGDPDPASCLYDGDGLGPGTRFVAQATLELRDDLPPRVHLAFEDMYWAGFGTPQSWEITFGYGICLTPDLQGGGGVLLPLIDEPPCVLDYWVSLSNLIVSNTTFSGELYAHIGGGSPSEPFVTCSEAQVPLVYQQSADNPGLVCGRAWSFSAAKL